MWEPTLIHSEIVESSFSFNALISDQKSEAEIDLGIHDAVVYSERQPDCVCAFQPLIWLDGHGVSKRK